MKRWTWALMLLCVGTLQASEAQFKEGNRLFRNGRYEDALKRYNDALIDTPNSSVLRFDAGDAVYQMGNFPAAEKQFADTAEQTTDPRLRAAAHYNRGNALFRQNKWKEAIEAYKDSLRNNPSDEDAKYNLGVALEVQKNPSQASAQPKPDKGGKNSKDQKESQQKASARPKPGEMSKEDAERLLAAAGSGEPKNLTTKCLQERRIQMKTGNLLSSLRGGRFCDRRSNLPVLIGGSPRRWRLFLATAMALLAMTAKLAFAADIQISASLDRQQVAMNEQAVLRVTITGNVSNLPAPQMPGLQAFQVSNAGTSQSYSWVNGQASASVTHTFVLTPTQVGDFTIPPVRLAVEGKTLESAPLVLKVVKGEAAAVPSPQAAPSNSGAPAAPGAPLAFVTATADKSSAYVGEPITFSFRLYNRAAFLRQPQYQPPEVSGFWAEDLPPQRNFGETVKGVPYQVVEVRTALFPTHPGKATIGSAALNVALQNFTSDPFAGDFFNFFNGGETRTLRTEPITVQVKALPEPAPAGFRGAVGDYTLTAELDKKSATVGQPLTLSLTVAGRGNIKSLPDIGLPPLANFRTFDANAATNIEKKNYHVQGSKVFKSVLIPTTSGSLSIPSVSFVFFDPAAQVYKTLKSRPLEVRVQPAAPGAAPAPLPNTPGAAQAPGIHVLNQDIRSCRNAGHTFAQPVAVTPEAFIGLNLLALLGMLGCGVVPLLQRIRSLNPVQQRFREARKAAGLRIQEAESALSRSDTAKAGSALNRALQGYLAAKFNRDESGLSLRSAAEALQARRVTAELIEKTKSIWNTLDLIQFAPAQSRPEDIRKSMAALTALLAGLEKEIPWRA